MEWRLSGCTVCHGDRDVMEWRLSGCTVCRGDRDVIERQLMTRIHQGCEYVVFPGACDI